MNARQTMPQYVYDWFLTKYGLRKLADQQLLKMFATISINGKLVVEREREREHGGDVGPAESSDARQLEDIKLSAAYLHTFGR